MPPRSRTAAAAALRVAAVVCILAATCSLCACAPAGDSGAASGTTTEDEGLYRAPPPGEDGAYLPEHDHHQGTDDDGAYLPEKYETDDSAGEGAYDAKKYEAVEGFDDGQYHPQEDAEEQDDGSYHPEVAERTEGDDGSYRTEGDEEPGGDDGSYRPEEYERSEGDSGLYNPQLYEAAVGDDGAYHPDIAEKVEGDDGSYHPDTSNEDNGGDYNPEIYEKVVGDVGSYHGSEEEDGSHRSNDGELHQEDDGIYHPEVHGKSGGGEETQVSTLNAIAQPAEVGEETTATRVRRQQSGGGLQIGSRSKKWDSVMNSGVVVKRLADKRVAREADGDVSGLQTLEEAARQGGDGQYHPERFETPAPGAASDWDKYWAGAAGTTEAADDGSYRPEHHTAEDYDERADYGQSSATPPVEPTEASDDGWYRAHEHTEQPAEDYDERADNGTDWRDNVVEQHDEGTEAADDGSYRPQEHGPGLSPRERRAAADDTEEVQLSPVVFHVAPKPASGSVTDDDGDDARATPPRPAEAPVPAAAV